MLRQKSSTTTAESMREDDGPLGPPPRVATARRPERTADLVARYTQTGTSECFDEIVRRYGAMVLAVCQAVTRNRHDAEDATQVTFFVLAERLRAGETIHSLGSWLQQVARRAAVDIRRSGTRRQRRERNHASPEVTVASAADQCDGDQLAALVREELDRVPAKYRVPLVLHYFGGMDFAEAARELGLKPATLGVRLFRGRKLLGERLARRGVSLSGPALAVCLARVIRSSLSHALRQSAVRAACASGMQPLAAAPPVLGSALASALASSKVKLLIAAALVIAATAGARAAAHHLPDLLDLGRLKPRLPSIRSSLPALRADAGAAHAHNQETAAPDAAPKGTPITIDTSRPAMVQAQPLPPPAPSASGAPAGGGVMTYAPSTSRRPAAGHTGSPAAGPGAIATSTLPAAGSHANPFTPASASQSRPNPTVAPAPGPTPTKGAGATAMAYAPLRQPGAAGGSAALYTATAAALPAGATRPSGATAINTLTGGLPPSSGTTYILSQSSAVATSTGTTGTGGSSTGVSAGKPPATKPSPYSGLLSITSTGSEKSPSLSFLNPNDPSVPTLPGGQNFLGVWSVPPGELADAPLTLSYDRQLLTDLGGNPSQVSLWAYDGKWLLVSSSGAADGATVDNPKSVQFFAVGTPEPTGAVLGAVVGLLLLMRRRRRGPA